ncbi:MAG: energy transducer TonB [Terracidiphilus sp.]
MPVVETTAGDIKHNEMMDLDTARSPVGTGQAMGPAADMGNDVLIQPETNRGAALPTTQGHELDAFLGKAFEEKPIWAGLYEGIRDVFFPPKLPPLELTCTPIPVPDRMAVKPNPWAIGISTTLNLIILGIAIWLGIKAVVKIVKPALQATNIDVGKFALKAPKAGTAAGGGGGGGSHSTIDPIKGHLPDRAKDPLAPPMVPKLDKPKLAVDAAINVQTNIQLPDNPNMPNLGVAVSPNVKMESNGQGGGAGMGSGYGGGLGNGRGNGFGPGTGGNTGNGVYQVGGGVSAPSLIYAPEAEFSDEARRAKYSGLCLISVIVDAQGNPRNPRVVRTLGMGLDEKALEAVRKYKFKPAMKDGRTPVAVMITIEVNFHLY